MRKKLIFFSNDTNNANFEISSLIKFREHAMVRFSEVGFLYFVNTAKDIIPGVRERKRDTKY